MQRFGFALQLVLAGILIHDRGFAGLAGRVTDIDGACLRDRLDPGGGVDQITGNTPLAADPERDHGLAGEDAGSRLKAGRTHLVSEDRNGVDQFEGGPHRSLRVVLLDGGRSPDSHDRVADELLHGAAIAADDGFGRGEIAAQEFTDILGVTLV